MTNPNIPDVRGAEKENEFHSRAMAHIRGQGKPDGWFAQFDMLILHTVGAKSGQQRRNPLVYQPSEEGEFFVVASNRGEHSSSSWYYNVLAHPDQVSVEIGDDHYPVAVREVAGAERDRIYRTLADRFEMYAEYQRKTSRAIPVLGLSRTQAVDYPSLAGSIKGDRGVDL
ncbi:nitroreductase family deazaflavin-dependent oxidoreductase [Mycobacteroides sp. LB1]|uniref:nitroreductase family deazaflavin-dependent oxidoreductase n=1 Tax=Mycobacteroides sp. LB1 TaxID=2750814 RepID=UPI0015DED14B|nr:nitroreductase family deazaflavin-dependent oxidoreductase [Mycobacteroides sp. LB1]